MKSLILVAQLSLVVGLLAFAGCADSSPDGLMKQTLGELNKMADGFEAGKKEDDASMVAIKDRIQGITKKLDALGLSEEEKVNLRERHKGEIQKVMGRMMQANMKNAMDQMGSQMKDKMGGAMDKMQNKMQDAFK